MNIQMNKPNGINIHDTMDHLNHDILNLIK